MVHTSYLLLGGNEGPVQEYFQGAADILPPGLQIVGRSALYRTAAWGMEPGTPEFLNQVWEIRTSSDPHQLLRQVLEVEQSLGRVRPAKTSGQYANRKIDIDILLFDDEVIEDEVLQVPHPRLPERKFALVPLTELAGDYYHPREHCSIRELLAQSSDNSEVVAL